MSIYKKFLRPRLQINEEVEAVYAKPKLNYVELMQAKSLLVRQAELESELVAVNATTACGNGLTLLENINISRAMDRAGRLAERHGSPALAESWLTEAQEYKKEITDANNKE